MAAVDMNTGISTPSEFVVRNGLVMSMDPDLGDIPGADLLVKDGKIAAVGRRIASDAPALDARGMIVMPGLIDSHTHMWNCLWRSLELPPMFGHKHLAPHSRPEDLYAGVRLCAAEFLDAGITTAHAWEHNVRSPAHADAELQALADTGLRALYSYGYTDDMPPDQPANLQDMLRARREWQSDMIRIGYASRTDGADGSPPNPWPSGAPEVLRMEWAFARREGLPITHHVATIQSPPQAYYDIGGPDLLLVHGYHWGLEVWRRFADLGVKMSMSPYPAVVSYRTPVPFREMFEAGVQMSLSFDLLNRSGSADMFRMLQFASDIERLRSGTAPSDRRMLELVTIEGARSLGLEHITGSLTPGKSADLILIRADDLNMAPLGTPERGLVQSARPENVDTVVVNGRILKRAGELVGCDRRRIAAEALRTLHGVLERSGQASAVRTAAFSPA